MRTNLPLLRSLLAAAIGLAVVPAVASADATVSIAPNTITFAPETVEIQAGQKVTWNFASSALKHNIVLLPKDAPFPTTDLPENPNDFTAPINVASTFPHTFTEAGTFRYVCSLHDPLMKGTVTVRPADQPPPPPPPPPPPAPKPLPPEPIAFTRAIAGSLEIFTMQGSPDQPRQLTNTAGIDDAPAWSPDGTKIAFHSNRTGGAFSDADVFVMDREGPNQKNLTPNTLSRDADPAWSPDGAKIAFTSDREGDFDIWVMNADGSGLRQITSGGFDDFEPSWAADGRRIAFTSNRNPGAKREIFVVDVDPNGIGPGTNPRLVAAAIQNVAANPGLNSAVWAPKGNLNRIAYSKFRGSGPDQDICVSDVTALDSEDCLTTNLNNDRDPAWSPDGTKIMYARDVVGGAEEDLFVVNADSSGTPEGDPVTSLNDGKTFGDPSWALLAAPAETQPADPPPPPPPPPSGDAGGGGGAPPAGEPDTRPDPGTAPPPSPFLGLDEPHNPRIRTFRKLGLPVTARCVGVEGGTVKLTVSHKLARKLGLTKTTLAGATTRCGADRKAAALLKPGAKVRRALARPPRALARGLQARLTIALTGAGGTLRANLSVLIRR